VANNDQQPAAWLDIEITSDEYLHDIQRKIQAQTEICRWKCCWCAAAAPSANAFWPALSGRPQRTAGGGGVRPPSGAGNAGSDAAAAPEQLFNETLHSLNGEDRL
jgi:exonuclease SbcD